MVIYSVKVNMSSRIELQPPDFIVNGRVKRGTWNNIENQKEYMKWLEKKLGYTCMEDWYKVSKKDFISYKKLQLDYLERLKSAFTEDSNEFNKACVNIANDLEWLTENELKCPNFYDDCINLSLKSLNYLLDKVKISLSKR